MQLYEVFKSFDKLGRIVIPIDMRKYYGFDKGVEIKVIPTSKGILLTTK